MAIAIAKDFLLQQFFALIPFLMFNIYYRDKMRNYDRKFIILTCTVSLFISMTLSSSAVPGFFYDSRFVLIFFGLVFGGLKTGFILLAEFVLYRAYLGGVGWLPAMETMSIAFPLSIILYKLYQRTARKTLVILSAGLIISIIPIATIYFHDPDSVNRYLMFHIFAVPVHNALGIWLLVGLFQRAVSNKEIFIAYAQNERVNMVSHVAASLVHEVRNPLTTVKGFLQLIRRSDLNREKLEQYIDICESEMERTEGILSEYLSISKPAEERVWPIDLADQLQVVLEVMRPYANMNNVQLKLELTGMEAIVNANPDKFKQILINFVKNSIEACTGIPSGTVYLLLHVEKGKAVITIKDNGIGMDKEQVSRLGSIYFSTKSQGTGLGLTYSYQMIRNLGGSVKVSSQPRVGTQFMIWLPLCSGESESA
jgi:two-component system, sporulation sensor kinase B